MSQNFDERTAYKSDYRHYSGVELADFNPSNEGLTEPVGIDPTSPWRYAINGIAIREEDITNPDFVSSSIGISLSTSTTVFCCWNPTDQDFNPKPHDWITRADGTTWKILNVRRLPFSRWIVAADLSPANVD